MYVHSTTVLCDTYCHTKGCLQCLSNFDYDVGHQGLEINPCIKFRFFVSFMHITFANQNVLARLFFEKYIILTMTIFVRSQCFISLPSFMFVGTAVSEIRESNRNKEKENKQMIVNVLVFHYVTKSIHVSCDVHYVM